MPGAVIIDMQRDGAGFAGFATWFDYTPAHLDLFAFRTRTTMRTPTASSI